VKRLAVLLAGLLLSACARNTPIDPAVLAPPSASATPASSFQPVAFPRDDGPHGDLTEWWYYTGHLADAAGRTYGFELVFFQAIRRDDPPSYAAHFAITDNGRGDFRFDQRSQSGKQVHAGDGLNFALQGWALVGANGHDHLKAAMPDYAIDLDLTSAKPAVLHDGRGLISFGPAGDSYYYSRTHMDVAGTVTDHGQPLTVSGLAWMDHQWGNFISNGGWDWYSIQLDDNSEVMLFFLRDAFGKPTINYGTYVAPDGTAATLPSSDFSRQALGSWRSSESGVTYPSGWRVTAGDATLTLTPTLKDQELRTTQSTGLNYWEGDVTVSGAKGGRPVGGQGYVELVGYH
jgi:predicted secreted hydrolase